MKNFFLPVLLLFSFITSCTPKQAPLVLKGDIFFGHNPSTISDNPINIAEKNKPTTPSHNPFMYTMTNKKTEEFSWPVKNVINEIPPEENPGLDSIEKICDDGMIIEANTGEPIMSFAHGAIEHVGQSMSNQGNIIILGNTNYTAVYMNVGKITVKHHQLVSPGDIIGHFGNHGYNTGKICFSLRKNGIPIPARSLIPE